MSKKKVENKKKEKYSQEEVLDYLAGGKEVLEIILQKDTKMPLKVEIKAGFYAIQNLMLNKEIGPLEKKLRDYLLEKKYSQVQFENRKQTIFKELGFTEEELNLERGKGLTLERMIKELVVDGKTKEVLLKGMEKPRLIPYLNELYLKLVQLIGSTQNPRNEDFLLES